MKRAITALTLVCALMLSVVACQVYNPTNNETLYTAMRTEGAISWADYSKKFTEADNDGKYDILKEYETFRKLHKDQKAWEEAIAAYEAENDAAEAKKLRKAVLYTVEDLKALWDKEFDVLWDWNGKM